MHQMLSAEGKKYVFCHPKMFITKKRKKITAKAKILNGSRFSAK
jgi:hypothetical protein